MARQTLIVVGNGMVGQRFLECLVDLGGTDRYDVVTFAEEPRLAYDRVALSSWFDGATEQDLRLADPSWYGAVGITVHVGEKVTAIDRRNRTVHTNRGAVIPYDVLVLATGSTPFVPPIPGNDAPGCFVYRTIEDLIAIRTWAEASGTRRGAVVGGGLLGLEAANALRSLGLETSVVEFAPRLMPMQLDAGGAAALQARIEELDIQVLCSRAATEVEVRDGKVAALAFGSAHEPLPTDLVVFSAGIRPRDELARACGLEVGDRGGVIVDDGLRTSDQSIYAIGEVAMHKGRVYGLVGPGYEMARVAASRLCGEEQTFSGADVSTKLKLLGVDVASFGDAFATAEGTREVVYADEVRRVYKKLVLAPSPGGRGAGGSTRIVGGMLVGDASAYQSLLSMARGDLPTPAEPELLILPSGAGGGNSSPAVGAAALGPQATICSCNNVDKQTLSEAIAGGCHAVADLKAATRAGTGCGGCVPLVNELLRDELSKAGIEVSNNLCEHFALTRQELFSLVRLHRYTTFSEILARHGTGRGHGCDICKPVVASILASLSNGYILDGEQAALQDTNDHVLANLQKDGTYSVVPRVPGGEITPAKLIVLGEVATEFGLYTKITGGQRIDLFGARLEQLPAIWRRLIDAGFESGHAYGKAVRTVKSCVGSTWCRYGVQDSVAMAIAIELRYRGLRAPHKLKLAVSGCARECAEAQSKDVGVIATERGWNLYVAGNGGMRPRHADLFAEDLDGETLIRYIDRFLMFYIRTADRLERTATWIEKLDGGVDYVRSVVIDDVLGIAAELEADMQRHVDTYECEWKATIENPERLARFVPFVNEPDTSDPDIVFVTERGQPRPARPEERERALREVGVEVRV